MKKHEKDNTTYFVLHSQNSEYIANQVQNPVSRDEIRKNIAMRLWLPYPNSSIRVALYRVASLMFFLITVVIGVGSTLISQIYKNVIEYNVLYLLIGTLFSLVALFFLLHFINLVKCKNDSIDNIYKRMSDEKNLVDGILVGVSRYHRYRLLHYRLANEKIIYIYATKLDFEVDFEKPIKLLYLNKKIHVIL